MVTTIRTIYKNNPLIFGVNLTNDDDRLDCAWFNPVSEEKIEQLRGQNKASRKLVKLKTIADVGGGKRLPKGTVIQDSETGVIPYIRGMDIKNLKVNISTAAKIDKEIHQKIQNYQLKKSDIVITTVGTIGEVGIVENEVGVCDFTENVARVRVKDEAVLAKFLLHFLDSNLGKTQTERFSVGSLQYKLSLQSCRNIEIYLPTIKDKFDLEKQRKILDSVYSIFSEASNHKQKGLEFIAHSKTIVSERLKIPLITNDDESKVFEVYLENSPLSRLDARFNNPLREKLLFSLKKYVHKTLGLLTKPQAENTIIPKDYYRLVELEQIDESTGKILETKEVPELGSEKILLKGNSLLISKLQPEKGKVAIVTPEFDGCVGSSELVPLILNTDQVSLRYLWVILRSNYVLKQWEYELTGSSRMRIGPNEISNTIIPIVDSQKQSEIVEEVEETIRKGEKEMEMARNKYVEARTIFESLLFE